MTWGHRTHLCVALYSGHPGRLTHIGTISKSLEHDVSDRLMSGKTIQQNPSARVIDGVPHWGTLTVGGRAIHYHRKYLDSRVRAPMGGFHPFDGCLLWPPAITP